jgi:methylphosphotriester-DNA--protein-cysteine methyltransferase
MMRPDLKMIAHANVSERDLIRLIRGNSIVLGGNKRLKIYGTLRCSSGKRMKRENRVFFSSEQEAIQHGFRPCKKCLDRKVSKKRIANASRHSEI